VLIEWLWPNGCSARGYVPAEVVLDGRVERDSLDAAAPYGAPWEELIDLQGLTPERVANELRRQNVWTAADLDRNPHAFATAVLRALPATASAGGLRRAADKYE